jgi:hypothetical protein
MHFLFHETLSILKYLLDTYSWKDIITLSCYCHYNNNNIIIIIYSVIYLFIHLFMCLLRIPEATYNMSLRKINK